MNETHSSSLLTWWRRLFLVGAAAVFARSVVMQWTLEIGSLIVSNEPMMTRSNAHLLVNTTTTEPHQHHHHNSSSINNSKSDDTTLFWLENLNLEQNVSCGRYKCFFRLKHNPHVAYVVQQESSTLGRREKRWEAAWKFGETLKNNFSQEHLMLERPHDINISRTLATHLNAAHLVRESTSEPILEERYEEGALIVQKVRPVPKPSLLFGCSIHKMAHFFDDLDRELLAFVENKDSFRRHLLGNITGLMTLIETTRIASCLVYDFQVFVDVHGNIYHFDLDRCFNSRDNSLWLAPKGDVYTTKRCLKRFEKRIKAVLQLQ